MDKEIKERMDNLHSYKKMDVALEMLEQIAHELVDEGFDEDDTIKYIEERVGIHFYFEVDGR